MTLGEVGIQRDEDATILNREAENCRVCRPRKAGLGNRNRVVPLLPQLSGVQWREVLLEEKLH